MTQQTSPWIEGAYGWSFGESNWNTGMDQNLLKFSFLFDGNIDGVVGSLPAAVNGQAYFLTTDNRLYFAAGSTWFSSPTPKWFIVTIRSTGETWQFNGTTLNLIPSLTDLDTRLDAVELTVSNLGTAAFEDVGFFTSAADFSQFESDLASTSLTLGATKVGRATRHITSITELRTVSGRYDGDVIYLKGHTILGYGAGNFRWLSASTATDDNGAIIQPTGVPTGRWFRIVEDGSWHVDMWGADPTNEATDSLPAFEACRDFVVSNGIRVGHFGPGTYGVSSSIDHNTGDSFYNGSGLPQTNGLRWVGAGMRSTSVFCSIAGGAFKIFRFDGNMNNNTNNLTPVAQWWSGIEECTLKSDSNTFTTNTAAIYLRAVWGFRLRNVNIERMPGDGIFVDGVTAAGTDDADGSANCVFDGLYGQEGGGKLFSCEKSKHGSILIQNVRLRGWFRGGLYLSATDGHLRNLEFDAIGSVGNTDACPIKFVQSQTLSAARGMYVDGAVIENCPWLSIDVEHCHTGAIRNVVLHPFLNLSQAGVITQPKLFRFEKPTGNSNEVRNFIVESIEIQPYSVPIGDTREFQFIDAQGLAEVDVRNIERRTPGVPDLNMFVIGSGTKVSLNSESLTIGAFKKSLAYLQVTGASGAVTGAGAAAILSTSGATVTTDARGLLSVVSMKPTVSPFMLSSYIKIGGVLQLGGMATTHTTLLVEVLKNGGTPVTILNQPLVSSSQATRSFPLPTVAISCTKNDNFDLRVTVSGTGATVTIGTGTRYDVELT